MFGSLGGPELLLILALALLLFGPRKLPDIGRTIGRSLAEFRKATSEFKSNLQREVDLDKIRETRDSLAEAGREVKDSVRDVQQQSVARGSLADTASTPPPKLTRLNSENPTEAEPISGDPDPDGRREQS